MQTELGRAVLKHLGNSLFSSF